MTTAIIHHPIFKEHDTGPGHPETPSRYSVVMEALRGDDELWSKLREAEATEAARGDIQAAFTAALQTGRTSGERRHWVSRRRHRRFHAFTRRCEARGGAPCQAIDLIGGERTRSCPCVRRAITPRKNERWDFVFSITSRLPRDTRNGSIPRSRKLRSSTGTSTTATARREFYDDPTVYFFSSHQYPWYPGTGTRGEKGTGRGLGYTLNLPLRAATPAVDQKRGFEAALDEMSNSFTPDLIIISAGFDSHIHDPLGQLLLRTATLST